LLDLLIKNGLVVDGSGNPGFYGSVGVDGDTLHVFRGDSSGLEAARVFDAGSKVVCPGFIDMHSHSELKLMTEPDHQAKIRQGVTTEAIGMDGLSYAPISPPKLEQLLTFLAAINGTPPPDTR